MAKEIERKFLVSGDGWQGQATASKALCQAYLARTDKAAMRVRIIDDHDAFLTVKNAQAGTTRSEFEYAIPVDDARGLLELHVGTVIEKRRHIVPAGDLTWEIDVFSGAYDGLVMAEIELPDAQTSFDKPLWLGVEVTEDRRYYNANLATGDPADIGLGGGPTAG